MKSIFTKIYQFIYLPLLQYKTMIVLSIQLHRYDEQISFNPISITL